MRLREFAPASGGNSGDYLRALASAWYNGTFDSGSLQKGIKSQEDVERLLNRGIVCPDGKTRKLHIDYNSDFDGVEIYSDDYYNHGDESGELDSRTGQPFGPYDHMEFAGDELDEGVAEGLNEFAPAGGGGNIPRGPKTPRRGPWGDNGEDPYQLRRYNRSVDFFDQFDSDGVDKQNFDKATGEYEGYYFDRDAASGITQIAYFKFDDPTKIGDNDPGIGWYYEPIDEGVAEGLNEFAPDSNDGGEEDALHKYAKMWWAGDEATQMQIEKVLDRMGWEIGEDEGSYDNGGVFVVRAGDINGNSYQSWAAEELTEVSDPWGSQGRYVGDTGPAQITTTVARVQLKPGDQVIYKPTEQRARIEALSRDSTQARIHIATHMGGRTFNCKTSDLKALSRGLAESHDLCNVCGQTPCNCSHLSEEFDLIESIVEKIAVHNGVDADVIWEDLESLSDDELYVFAVTSEPIMEDWQKVNKQDRTSGMSRKAVKAYRREHPGSKLKTAVTTKPSKLKRGSKASKRRKSYCSRSRGQMKMHNISCAKTPDKAICKARRRWNC